MLLKYGNQLDHLHWGLVSSVGYKDICLSEKVIGTKRTVQQSFELETKEVEISFVSLTPIC